MAWEITNPTAEFVAPTRSDLWEPAFPHGNEFDDEESALAYIAEIQPEYPSVWFATRRIDDRYVTTIVPPLEEIERPGD